MLQQVKYKNNLLVYNSQIVHHDFVLNNFLGGNRSIHPLLRCFVDLAVQQKYDPALERACLALWNKQQVFSIVRTDQHGVSKTVYGTPATTQGKNSVVVVSNGQEVFRTTGVHPAHPTPVEPWCVVLPFREDHTKQRTKQLREFVETFPKLVKVVLGEEWSQQLHLLVVEQYDAHKFNLGALRNAGFVHLTQKVPEARLFVFSDIDLLPTPLLLPYYLAPLHTTNVDAVSLARRGHRYEASAVFFGGVSAFQKDAFLNINGYPSNFSGWGGEDDAAIIRLGLRTSNRKIWYPPEGHVVDLEVGADGQPFDFKHKKSMLVDKETYKWEKLVGEPNTFRTNGVSSVASDLKLRPSSPLFGVQRIKIATPEVLKPTLRVQGDLKRKIHALKSNVTWHPLQGGQGSKIAYLFLVLSDPHKSNVWEKFFASADANTFTVYVHPKHPLKRPFFKKHVIDNVCETKWGTSSLVKAHLNLLAAALKDPANKRFVLVSDSCIPVRPHSEIQPYLMHENSSMFSLMEFDKEGLQDTGSTLMNVPVEKVSKAAQWCILTREDAQTLVDTRNKYTVTQDTKEFALDEVYALSVLKNETPNYTFIDRKTTWVKWNRDKYTQVDAMYETYKRMKEGDEKQAKRKEIKQLVYNLVKQGYDFRHPFTYKIVTGQDIQKAIQEGSLFFRKVNKDTKLVFNNGMGGELDTLRKLAPFPTQKPAVPEYQHGWLGKSNMRMLECYVPGNKLIVEMGTWLGKSAQFMLNIDPNLKLVCVDHWEGGVTINSYDQGAEINKVMKVLYETFCVNVWKYRDRIFPLRTDGRKGIAKLVKHGFMPDMIYLDMDHEYEAVLGDLKAIYKVAPNVRTLGDDLKNHKGVGKAVKEFLITVRPDMNMHYDRNCFALSQDPPRKLERSLNVVVAKQGQKQGDGVVIICCKPTETSKMDEYITTFRKIVPNMSVVGVASKDHMGQALNDIFLQVLQKKPGCTHVIFQNTDWLPKAELVPFYYTPPEENGILWLESSRLDFCFSYYLVGTISIHPSLFVKKGGYVPRNPWLDSIYKRVNRTIMYLPPVLDGCIQSNWLRKVLIEKTMQWDKTPDGFLGKGNRNWQKEKIGRNPSRRYTLKLGGESVLPYPVFWINLAREPRRKKHMEKELGRLGATHFRVEAYDRVKIESYGFQFSKKTFKKNTKGEIVCCMSHLKALKKGYENGSEYFMVLEDDVNFELIPYWDKSLKEMVNSVQGDWDVLQLSNQNSDELLDIYKKKKTGFLPWKSEYYSCTAYLVRRDGVKKLVQHYEGKMFDTENIQADHFVYNHTKTLTLAKPMFVVEVFKSDLEQGRLEFYKGSKQSSRLIQKYMYGLKGGTPNPFPFPVYWINLDREKIRRKYMTTSLDRFGAQHTRIQAYDRHKLDTYGFMFSDKTRKHNTSGEIACCLSHFKAIKTAYKNGDDKCLVLEDDAGFELIPKWENSLEEVCANAPKGWEIIQLSISNPTKLWEFFENPDIKYKKWVSSHCSTVAYIITKKGMQKILNNVKKYIDVKHFKADVLIYKLVETFTLTKPLFLFELFHSDLEEERQKFHNSQNGQLAARSDRLIRKYMYDLKDQEIEKFIPMISKNELVNMIEGKKVIIVGPADYINKEFTAHGSFIDSFDVVIKLNGMIYFENKDLEKHYGKRMDILISAFWSRQDWQLIKPWESYRYCLEETYKNISDDVVLFENNPRKLFKKILKKHGDVIKQNKHLKYYLSKNNDYKRSINFLKKYGKLTKTPTTGLLAIADILLLNPSQLYVTGVTMYMDKNHNAHYNGYDKDTPVVIFSGFNGKTYSKTASIGHSIFEEQKIFKELISRKKIKVDRYIKKLIKA